MGVQFNLLPDVKLEFDRQQRTKRLVYTLSTVVCLVVIGIFAISFVFVNVGQRKALKDADGDIKKYSNQLKGITDLDKVLTIQNQLTTLPGLHQDKHITSRFFTYLPQITPSKIFVGQVNLDLSAGTVTINGTSDTLETVNSFVDTLKFTQMKVGDSQSTTPAFTNVVLTSAGRTDKGASYTVSASFDPALFDGTQNVALQVPKEITTRSVTQSPDINSLLFNGDTGKPKDQTGGQ